MFKNENDCWMTRIPRLWFQSSKFNVETFETFSNVVSSAQMSLIQTFETVLGSSWCLSKYFEVAVYQVRALLCTKDTKALRSV